MISKPRAEISLFNYRSRQLEVFEPSETPIGLYSCGPTVYSDVHIGNLRTFIFEDVLRRTLGYAGYQVKQVMNVTDVDDKIIRDAGARDMSISEFSQPYLATFFKDIRKVGIELADSYPRATDHIDGMISLIQQLMGKGVAYAVDGSVYFAVDKFPAYGQLAQIDRKQLKPGARVDADEYDKEAVEDFALWKAAKPADEEVGAVWDSPWGRGRPGWHIECSAMSMAELGESFDLHTGAIDLLFPHHEDEIAQAEAATGKPFARFFLEAEHLLVDGQKMAKSAGNYYTLRDIEEKGIDPLAFRYLLLGAHYRTKLNFTWESLQAAAQTFKRLKEQQYRPAGEIALSYIEEIDRQLFHDLNVPAVLGLLHEENNPKLWEHYDAVLGLGLQTLTAKPEPAIETLLKEREKARAAGDFARGDALRDELHKAGWEIEDRSDGPHLVRRSS